LEFLILDFRFAICSGISELSLKLLRALRDSFAPLRLSETGLTAKARRSLRRRKALFEGRAPAVQIANQKSEIEN
jgi:hypothetical protein